MTTLHWMGHFLSQRFFAVCEYHRELRKSEANIYCIECNACLCTHCIVSGSHGRHHFLQIRRYVYQDVIKLDDMDKYIDCSKIQTFVVNRAKVIFLNPKPYASLGITGPFCSCLRPVVPPNLFCSIACQVFDPAAAGGGDEREESDGTAEEEEAPSAESSTHRTDSKRSYGDTVVEVPSVSAKTSGARRRKGIPRRAHFF